MGDGHIQADEFGVSLPQIGHQASARYGKQPVVPAGQARAREARAEIPTREGVGERIADEAE